MNKLIQAILITILASVLAACSKKDNAAESNEPPSETEQALKESWADTKDAVSKGADAVADSFAGMGTDIKNWSYKQKAELAESCDKLSAKMDAQVAQWKQGTKNFSAKAKQEWNEGMAEFDEGKAKLSATLDKMGDASEDNWEAAKANLVAAWNEVEQGFAKMKAAATEKDEPAQ